MVWSRSPRAKASAVIIGGLVVATCAFLTLLIRHDRTIAINRPVSEALHNALVSFNACGPRLKDTTVTTPPVIRYYANANTIAASQWIYETTLLWVNQNIPSTVPVRLRTLRVWLIIPNSLGAEAEVQYVQFPWGRGTAYVGASIVPTAYHVQGPSTLLACLLGNT
jgi:hypothetical protein